LSLGIAKSRLTKQAFGIEIYDLMADLETNDDLSTEEKVKIEASFDAARRDIAVIVAKKECKMEKCMFWTPKAGGDLSGIPPSSGAVITTSIRPRCRYTLS
jgi:hypothetical protein